LRLCEEETPPNELWQKTKEILLRAAEEATGVPRNKKTNGRLSDATLQKAAEKRLARSKKSLEYRSLKGKCRE